jgi:hypothetical protein
MPLSNFRTSRSWQDAIDLGPSLVMLAEQLPGSEQMGLCWQLQQAMVELPATVAHDMMEDGSNTRLEASLRLVATLDLVEKIYPALDTAGVRDQVEKLVDRLQAEDFGDNASSAGPAPAVADIQAPVAAVMPASVTPPAPLGPAANIPVIPGAPAAPAPTGPGALPASPVAVEPAMDPTAAGPQSVSVAVQDSDEVPQENHVRPDSVQ